jgi:ABC-type multidrug transport system ATPase subunit
MSNTSKPIIDCLDVSKQFGYFLALKKISLRVKKNTIFGIVGENGAGKTTLIKIMAGLLKPTAGEVLIKGLNFKDDAIPIKKDIGILTDDKFLYEELSIFENLKYYDNLHLNFDKKDIKENIEKFTKMFNIFNWINEPIQNLSKGMKKKVDLIRVLIHHPSILFLDEPFSSLDQKTVPLLIDLILNLKKQDSLTIILSTHDIDLAQQICDEIIIIKKGKIVKNVSKEEIEKINIKEYM